jgi:hypothetical protein
VLGNSANLDVVRKRTFCSKRKDARAYGHSASRLVTLFRKLNDHCPVDKEITAEIKLGQGPDTCVNVADFSILVFTPT